MLEINLCCCINKKLKHNVKDDDQMIKEHSLQHKHCRGSAF